MGNAFLLQAAGGLGWEARAVQGLRTHLYIAIPLAILLLKVLIRFSAREEFMEMVRSITNLPLELMLVAMSFMLSDLCGLSSPYNARFQGQNGADLYAAIILFLIFVGSILISNQIRFVRILGGKLYIAVKQYRELAAQLTIPGTVVDPKIVGRILWAIAYCTLMAGMLLSCFALSFVTLAYVLHLTE